MGINGAAYATWAAPGTGGGRHPRGRLMDVTWSPVGAPLDIDPAPPAGGGQPALAVGVSAEGNAIVAWGEGPRVYARRVTGVNPSSSPQEPSLPDVGPARPARPTPPTSMSRTTARSRGRSSAKTSAAPRARSRAAARLDVRPAGAARRRAAHDRPRVAMNGRGQGAAMFEGGRRRAGQRPLQRHLRARSRSIWVASAPTPEPSPAHPSTARTGAIAAWLVDGAIKGRLKPEPAKPFENQKVTLSRPELGPVSSGQFATAADRVAGFAVAMIQGAPGRLPHARRLPCTTACPGRPEAIARSGWSNKLRPKLERRPGLDLWGPQRFRVVVGGQVVGETRGSSLTPSQRLRAWRALPYQVIAIDSRGQENPSRTRIVRFDNQGPKIKVTVVGQARRGSRIAGDRRARQ